MQYYSTGRPWGDILPRYTFLESLFSDKRVLEIGCGDGSGAVFLSERGAAQVVAVDREGAELTAARKRSVPTTVAFRSYDGRRLDLSTESIDATVAFGLEPSDGELLSEIERVLTSDGILITALAAPSHRHLSRLAGRGDFRPSPSFERFISWLQDRFSQICVLAQTPFFGFSIGWMGAEDEDLPLEMDTCLLPEEGEGVAFYLAICGREPLAFDYQSLVQLPYQQIFTEIEHHFDSLKSTGEVDVVGSGKLARLESELQLAEVKAVDRERFLHDARTRAEALERDIEQARTRIQKLERGLLAARGQAERRDQEYEAALSRASKLEDEFRASRTQYVERTDILRKLEDEREEYKSQITQLERRLVDSERQTNALRQQIVEKDRSLERLRGELHLRGEEELPVRRELLNLLLGLPEDNPLHADEIPQLIRTISADRESLRIENARLREESEALERSADELQERMTLLEGEVAAARRVAEETRNEIGRWRDAAEEKQSWLDAERNEVERLKSENEEHARQLASAQRQLEAAERDRRRADDEVMIASLREENRGLKRSLEKLGAEIQSVKCREQDLASQRGQLAAENEQRQEQLVQASRRAERLQMEWEEKSRELESLCSERDELLERLSAVQAHFKRAEDRSREAGSRAEHLASRLVNAERTRLSDREEIDTLRQELADSQQEAMQLRQRLTSESERLSALQARLVEQAADNRELESDLVEVVNRLQDGESREQDRLRLIQELTQRIEHQSVDLEDAWEKVGDLTHELYEARAHEEELAAAIELLRAALSEQEQQREKLESDLSNLQLGEQDSEHQLEQELSRVQSELAVLQRRLFEREEQNDRNREAVQRLQAQSQKWRKELDASENRLAETLDRLAQAEAARQRSVGTERELAWHRAELERMNASLQLHESELDEGRLEYQRCQEEVERLLEENERMHRSMLGIQEEGRVQKLQLDELKAELQQTDQHRGELTTLQDRVRDSQSRLEACQLQMDERNAELEEAHRRIAEERTRTRGMEQELTRFRGESRTRIESLEQSLEASRQREQTLQSRLAALQEQLGELGAGTGSELASMSEQVRRRDEQMRSLTERLAEMEQARLAAEQRATAAEQRLAAAPAVGDGDRLVELERRLGESQQALERERARSIDGQHRLEELSEKLARMQAQRPDRPSTESDTSSARFEADLSATQRRITELEGELSQLRQYTSSREQELGRQLEINKKALAESYAEIRKVREQSVRSSQQLKELLAERERRIQAMERELAAARASSS